MLMSFVVGGVLVVLALGAVLFKRKMSKKKEEAVPVGLQCFDTSGNATYDSTDRYLRYVSTHTFNINKSGETSTSEAWISPDKHLAVLRSVTDNVSAVAVTVVPGGLKVISMGGWGGNAASVTIDVLGFA